MAISDNIFAKCLPAISTDIDRCGAVTMCDLSPTTEDQLASIYKDGSDRWRIIGALLEQDFIGKACQIKQNGMYDWIRATSRDISGRKLRLSELKRGIWEVMPFVQMLRKGPINNEYWNVANGTEESSTFNGAAYTERFDVSSQTGITGDARWFPERMRVFINGISAGGSATRTAWKVVGAEALDTTTVRVYVTSENANSFLAAAKLELPEIGLLTRGTPNVNDHEKYCAQIPGLNTNQLTPYWMETVRYGICDDELYKKYISAIKSNNPFFKQFGDVESVELNKQIIEDYQRRHAWSFFFNKPLANQDLTNWDQLEQITVYSDDSYGNYLNFPFEGRCIGRRANTVGIYEQMAECGRVKDLQGQILNIPELQDALYKIKRMRESNGIPADTIELFTDSFYAVQLGQGFLRYFSAKSEGLLRLNQDLMAKSVQGPLGFVFTEINMDYPNVKLRIVTHPFYDDMVDAMTKVSTTLTAAGRFLWILDWTTNYQGMIESNSVMNRTGNLQELAAVNHDYLCVMKVPAKSQRLTSMTYANVAECPAASLLLENIADGVPEHLQKVGNYADYYGDYTG